MKIDFGNFNDRFLPEIQKLSKNMWDLEAALSSANSLKYVNEVKKLFSQEASAPSEDFVKYFASRIYDGHITAKVREQFAPIVKRAIQEHINDLINSRLESAKVDDRDIKPEVDQPQEDNATGGINTTDEELMAFIIIQTILRKVIAPSRIFMRDAKSYCAILLDDNNRKTLCRLYFNGKKKFICIFDAAKKEEKIFVETEDDLFGCGDKLVAALQTFLAGEQGPAPEVVPA
jgi:hypothetical protein